MTSRWGPLGDDTSAYTNERSRSQPVQRNFIISDRGPELSDDTGLFVWTAHEAGPAYYAVTEVVNGVEDRSLVAGRNATTAAVQEAVETTRPVLV